MTASKGPSAACYGHDRVFAAARCLNMSCARRPLRHRKARLGVLCPYSSTVGMLPPHASVLI